jgi:hypothetical protein
MQSEDDMITELNRATALDVSGIKVVPVNAANIPSLLIGHQIYALWINNRPSKDQKKLRKKPIDTKTGYGASSTDPSTWSDFAATRAAYENGGYYGMGIMMPGTAIAKNAKGEDLYLHGFDFDNVAQLNDDGALQLIDEAYIRQMLDQLGPTYTEHSPSGTGFRKLALSTKPPSSGKNKNGIEYYSRERFLTLTGQVFECGELNEIAPEVIDAFEKTYLSTGKRASSVSPPQNDYSPFWDLGPRPPHLEGPDALTYMLATGFSFPETPENMAQIDFVLACFDPDMEEPEFFRMIHAVADLQTSHGWNSAKEKARKFACGGYWGSPSEKYNLDSAHVQITQAEADQQFDRLWERAVTPRTGEKITVKTLLYKGEQAKQHRYSRAPIRTGRLTLDAGLIDTSPAVPPKRAYVVGNFGTSGKVTTLAGLGGVSKTTFTMQVATALALHEKLGDISCGEGSSLLLLGEEDQLDIARRFKAILDGRDDTARQKVGQRVRAFPMAGQDIRLTRLNGGNVERTAFVEEIVNCAKNLHEACSIPVKLIVIDHVRLAMAGDGNDADHATSFMATVTDIAVKSDACVMVLAHSPKSSIPSDGKEREPNAADIAGSGAFVNNARSAEVLVTMNKAEAKKFGIDAEQAKQYVKLVVVKNNIGRTGDEYWFRREEVPTYGTAILEPVSLAAPAPVAKGSDLALHTRLIDLIREKNGRITANGLRGYATKDGRLKASQTEAAEALDSLIAQGKIRQIKVTQHNQDKYEARVGTVVLETD